jgi:hypothetical protein
VAITFFLIFKKSKNILIYAFGISLDC